MCSGGGGGGGGGRYYYETKLNRDPSLFIRTSEAQRHIVFLICGLGMRLVVDVHIPVLTVVVSGQSVKKIV